jgi:hypothetical protein
LTRRGGRRKRRDRCQPTFGHTHRVHVCRCPGEVAGLRLRLGAEQVEPGISPKRDLTGQIRGDRRIRDRIAHRELKSVADADAALTIFDPRRSPAWIELTKFVVR